jgi:DNA-binding CsgD family transcriptional regulator
LETAFGLRSNGVPDRFRVGLAALSLLASAAEEQPLVCVVDDAHWLDFASVQTLAFVARRLAAESVALVFAVREPHEEHPLRGLPELVISGLDDTEAQALLESVVAGPMDDRVRDRIVAETRGNPLALLELPHNLTPEELEGGFGRPDAPALTGQIEDGFRRRVEPLPEPTRALLLVAAAEPLGDPTLVWQAAGRLGVGVEAAAPAVAAGLVEFANQVRFRHPLVRSAVYRAASPTERQAAHGALADATDAAVDPDRKIWHRAHASAGPDAAVADALERTAEESHTRCWAATSAFLEEAARLTPDPVRRGQRMLAAAQARQQSGSPDDASSLLAYARAAPMDDLQRAHATLLDAQLAYDTRRGSDAPALLLAAARQLEPLDVALSRRTYLDALAAAVAVGHLAGDETLLDLASAARAAPEPSTPTRPPDLLLEGLAVLMTDGRPAATELLTQAVAAFRGGDVSAEEGLRWMWLAGRVADELMDDGSWHALVTRQVDLARQAGALTVLPTALRTQMIIQVVSGELDDAAALQLDVQAVVDAAGTQLAAYGAGFLAAWRGDERLATELIAATIADVTRRGEGMGVSVSHLSSAVLNNGLGRYQEALEAAKRACEFEDLGLYAWGLSELVEAATHLGEHDAAVDAVERLAATHVSGTDWARGVVAGCRALVSDGAAAEGFYREAIECFDRTRIQVGSARLRLHFGEWLRRQGRRVDARDQLRLAHQMLGDMGLAAFAERARRELAATGETVRKRSVETLDELTAQETLIARLAGEGRTNPEIAAELFISPRTVEWHMHKVFNKLGVRSRKELRRARGSPDARARA